MFISCFGYTFQLVAFVVVVQYQPKMEWFLILASVIAGTTSAIWWTAQGTTTTTTAA